MISQTAGVMDEVPDRDSLTEVGDLGHVPANVIVQRELALLGKHHNRHRSELFGYRRDMKDRCGRDRNTVFEVRHPVSVFVNGLPILDHRKRASGGVGFVESRENLIDFRGNRFVGVGHVRFRLTECRHSEEQCQQTDRISSLYHRISPGIGVCSSAFRRK